MNVPILVTQLITLCVCLSPPLCLSLCLWVFLCLCLSQGSLENREQYPAGEYLECVVLVRVEPLQALFGHMTILSRKIPLMAPFFSSPFTFLFTMLNDMIIFWDSPKLWRGRSCHHYENEIALMFIQKLTHSAVNDSGQPLSIFLRWCLAWRMDVFLVRKYKIEKRRSQSSWRVNQIWLCKRWR